MNDGRSVRAELWRAVVRGIAVQMDVQNGFENKRVSVAQTDGTATAAY